MEIEAAGNPRAAAAYWAIERYIAGWSRDDRGATFEAMCHLAMAADGYRRRGDPASEAKAQMLAEMLDGLAKRPEGINGKNVKLAMMIVAWASERFG